MAFPTPVRKAPVLSLTCLKKLGFFVFLAGFFLLASHDAFATSVAGNIKDYAKDVATKTSNIGDVLNYISFIMGLVLIGLGLSGLRKTFENPGDAPVKNGLVKLFVGGIFVALPYVSGMLQGTMTASTPFAILKMGQYKFQTSAVTNNSVGGLIANGINNTGVLVQVAGVAAFFIAIFLTIRGIQMVRTHIETPQNQPLADALKRLAVGGALFSFPMIVNVVYETFGSKAGPIGNSGWSSTAGTAGGLDGMMVHFMQDLTNPAFFAIEIFCYIAGILMVLFAMQRLVRTAQDGARGPLGFGTIIMFIVAGILLSFPQFLGALDASLIGGGSASTKVEFMSMSGAVDPAQIQNAKNVFSAVLAFMAVIGFLSVVRGLFLLKSFADGNNQATMMSVVTHIVAGSLCINLGAFINAVQTSLGVTTFPVTFN